MTDEAQRLIAQSEALEREANNARDMVKGLRVLIKSNDEQAHALRVRAQKLIEAEVQKRVRESASNGLEIADIAKLYGISIDKVKRHLRIDRRSKAIDKIRRETESRQLAEITKANHERAEKEQAHRLATALARQRLTREYLFTCSKAISEAQGERND